MDTTEALPERYEVGKRGTPDPPRAQYYVFNFVHDFEARVTLQHHVHNLRARGRTEEADALHAALAESQQAHHDYLADLYERRRKLDRRRRRR